MTLRRSETGVTLIEMLVALVVAALIGIAGFTLLDGVATRDAQLGGRIDLIRDRDRAFQLLTLDASQAHRASLAADTGLMIRTSEMIINWSADETGVTRRIIWSDGRTITQRILRESARITPHSTFPRAVVLGLIDVEIERIVLVTHGLSA